MDYEKISQSLCEFIKNKVKLAGLNNALIGLSGGIDSALVATLCKKALGQNVFALLMPTKFSNRENLSDALELCKHLNLEYKIIEIQDILDAFVKKSENIDRLSMGNFAARIRMTLLYDYSVLKKALVVGTSNKSELLLGYGTIYGDLAYAFNPIGELYKSEIYEFAKYLNLNEKFIKKLPSADLWLGQSDEEDLGFSYKLIDRGLKALQNQDKKALELLDKRLVHMLQLRIKNNAFKRSMPELASIKDHG